jgi:tripeptidyl-peptidase-1
MIAPKDESRDLVMQWLERNGLKECAELSPRSDSVIVKASVSQVERLLNAEYSPFGMIDFCSFLVPHTL